LSRTGVCPSCGASLTFEVGSSRSAVCRFCKTLVVRRGQDFDAVGKVSDLVPTGAKVNLGARGVYFGERFTVAGRVQLEWDQGVWDEWYVAFGDERWGWLAEAGGHYYLTFARAGVPIPAQGSLVPGQAIEIERLGRYVVTDLKRARVVGAMGELPDEIEMGATTYTADLESQDHAFATIDYGLDGDEPVLFAGHEVGLASLELQGGLPPEATDTAAAQDDEAITCGNCGAPITLVVPGQTVRLVCGSCNALISAKKAGKVIKVLDRHLEEPPIALGAKGKLRGAEVVVAGWMRRGCFVDQIHYPWDELLLYEPATTKFSWLVISEGHWSLATSIPAGEVERVGDTAYHKDKTFKRYSSVVGEVELVLGEFPWKVKIGEAATLEDFIMPPEGLSLEANGEEINWSFVEHLTHAEVAEAFKGTEVDDPPRIGVGAVQPWPLEKPLRELRFWIAGGVVALLVCTFAFGLSPDHYLVHHDFGLDDKPSLDPTAEGAEAPLPSRTMSWVSEPFAVGRRAVEVRVNSTVDNGWVYLEGALIQEDTGEATFFGLESSYYHGYDDGESWSEGSRDHDKVLSSPGKGSYVLRADVQWDPALSSPPAISVQVSETGYSLWQLLLALSVVLSPLLFHFHRKGFEKRRWENSNVWYG
jgi:hypothetical protein